jgi:hypothetical protein
MDDERNRGKEYYQVNLDMGRLFWIAFLIGVVLISVFVFGFVIGGDRVSPKDKLEALKRGGSDLFRRDRLSSEQVRDELKILDLFDTDLEAETRYIDVESLEEAVQESEPVVEAPVGETEFPAPAREVTVAEKPAPKEQIVKLTAPEREVPVYRPVGDYYIQVGSFTQESNANKLSATLEKNLYKVKIVKAEVEGKTYYRVHVGPFEQRSVAVNTMTSMKRTFGLKDPFVLKKQS